ncbi:unnamed protein product, partial [Prorocentrum cordatum]
RARTAAPTPSSPPETTTGLRGQLSARARAGPPFLRGRRGSGSRHPRRGTGARRSPEARTWRLHTAHRTAPIDDRLCWEDFGCASHLQGTRESRNRWARPPSAGRRAASRRVEKAITKNPAPSAATTKSARSTCLCTVGNSQLQHTCAPQGAGIVSNPTAPGAMLPQRRAQRC